MKIFKKILVIAILLVTTFYVYKALTRHEEIKVIYEDNLTYNLKEEPKEWNYNFRASANLDLDYELELVTGDEVDLSKAKYTLYIDEKEVVKDATIENNILYKGKMEAKKEYSYSLDIDTDEPFEYSVNFK